MKTGGIYKPIMCNKIRSLAEAAIPNTNIGMTGITTTTNTELFCILHYNTIK